MWLSCIRYCGERNQPCLIMKVRQIEIDDQSRWRVFFCFVSWIMDSGRENDDEGGLCWDFCCWGFLFVLEDRRISILMARMGNARDDVILVLVPWLTVWDLCCISGRNKLQDSNSLESPEIVDASHSLFISNKVTIKTPWFVLTLSLRS